MIKTSYLSVIVIWSTTPLAIQWSSQSGVLFGLTSRMIIGLLMLTLLFFLSRQRLTQTKDAYIAYLTAGLGIYFSMSLVYWSAQFIPSGWMSVIFGLSPIMTGVLSILILHENYFSLFKILGMGLGFIGLLVMFNTSGGYGAQAVWGVCGIVLGAFTHSLGAVLLKRINAPITGLESTLGGLLIAVPLFAMTLMSSGEEVTALSKVTSYAILYLGIIATAIGFSMYFFILKKLDPVRVSLITLVTPICALYLGKYFNHELVTPSILVGTFFVLIGLALFEIDRIDAKENNLMRFKNS